MTRERVAVDITVFLYQLIIAKNPIVLIYLAAEFDSRTIIPHACILSVPVPNFAQPEGSNDELSSFE